MKTMTSSINNQYNFNLCIRPTTIVDSESGRIFLQLLPCDFTSINNNGYNATTRDDNKISNNNVKDINNSISSPFDVEEQQCNNTKRRRRNSSKPKNKNCTLFDTTIMSTSTSTSTPTKPTTARKVSNSDDDNTNTSMLEAEPSSSKDVDNDKTDITSSIYYNFLKNIKVSSKNDTPTDRDVGFNSPSIKSNNYPAGNNLLRDLINFYRCLLHQNNSSSANVNDISSCAKSIVRSFCIDYCGIDVSSSSSSDDNDNSLKKENDGKYYTWVNENNKWLEITNIELVQEIIIKALTYNIDIFSQQQLPADSEEDIESIISKNSTFINNIWDNRSSKYNLGNLMANEVNESNIKVGNYDVIAEDGYYNIIFDHLISKKLNDKGITAATTDIITSSIDRIDIALYIVNSITNNSNNTTQGILEEKDTRNNSLQSSKEKSQGRFLARNPKTNKWYELGYIPSIEYTIKKIWKASFQKTTFDQEKATTSNNHIMAESNMNDNSICSNESELSEWKAMTAFSKNSSKQYQMSDILETDVLFDCDDSGNCSSELINYHIGNKKYQDLLYKCYSRYYAGKKMTEQHKNYNIAYHQIIKPIKKSYPPGRFLKCNDNTVGGAWYEISNCDVIKNICQSLKEMDDADKDNNNNAKPEKIVSKDTIKLSVVKYASETKKQQFKRRFSHESTTSLSLDNNNDSNEDDEAAASLKQIMKNDKKRLHQLMSKSGNNSVSDESRNSGNISTTTSSLSDKEQKIRSNTVQTFLNDSSSRYVCSPLMSKLKGQFLKNFQSQNNAASAVAASTATGGTDSLNINALLRNAPQSHAGNSANNNLALSLKMAEMKRRNSLEYATTSTANASSVRRRSFGIDNATTNTSLNLATASALAAAQVTRRPSDISSNSIDAAQVQQLAAALSARSAAAQQQQVRRYSIGPTAGVHQGRRNSLEAIRSIEMERRMSLEGVTAAAAAAKIGGSLKRLSNGRQQRSPITLPQFPDQQEQTGKRNSMRRGSIELFKQASTNCLAQQIASVKSELEALVSSDSEGEDDKT